MVGVADRWDGPSAAIDPVAANRTIGSEDGGPSNAGLAYLVRALADLEASRAAGAAPARGWAPKAERGAGSAAAVPR